MWTYFGNELTTVDQGFYGFVYEIINNVTGRRYIGKNSFGLRKLNKSKVKRNDILLNLTGETTMAPMKNFKKM